MQSPTLLLLALTSTVSAHYSLTYPPWRGDSMATQWSYPCGGVNQTSTTDANRTKWPLTGGAVAFKPSHPWAQTYINLGLGAEVSRLNVTLVEPFNQTSNGTFCFPHITLPAGLEIKEGDKATIQVIQLVETGGALYNCADIEFSSEAEDPSKDVCFNSTGVGAQELNYGGAKDEEEQDEGEADDATATGNAAETSETPGAGVVATSSMFSVLLAGVIVAGMMI